jgi:hypothetical protein
MCPEQTVTYVSGRSRAVYQDVTAILFSEAVLPRAPASRVGSYTESIGWTGWRGFDGNWLSRRLCCLTGYPSAMPSAGARPPGPRPRM